jgi:hypothetical protein
MARLRVRVEIPERDKTLTVMVETTADPAAVAHGLAQREHLTGGPYRLRLKDSFQDLELVREGDSADFHVIDGD